MFLFARLNEKYMGATVIFETANTCFSSQFFGKRIGEHFVIDFDEFLYDFLQFSRFLQILYSESNDAHEESSADREVTKTFNPEAQCFRPIEIVSTSLSNLSLSPKIAVNQETPPTFQASPMYNPVTAPKNGLISPAVSVVQPAVAATQANGGNSASFLNRSQEPLTFTTATFAQTKFGSTKLKNSSKRTNR
jgi:protein Tob/BTG